jgi:uncharacterized membrane protein YfhO
VEHLPIWGKVDNVSLNDSNKKIEILSGQGKAEIVEWKSAKRIIKTIADESIVARIRTFYFPGWRASLDGTALQIQMEKESGAMLIDIPEGDHKLELKFVDTPVRYYGKLISLLSFVALGCFLLREKIRK